MRIKALTFFSPSHLRLYKTFMNSYPVHENVDLIIRFGSQAGDGNYKDHDPGFKTQVRKKVELVYEYLLGLNDDELLYFLDIDIIFYRSFYNDIINLYRSKDKDMLIQTDGPVLCSGQFITRKSKSTISFFETMLEEMDKYSHDQDALNKLLPGSDMTYDTLPDRYFSYGAWNGHKRWNGESEFYVPEDIVSHHLNWVVGVDGKLKLGEAVKNIVASR